MMQKKNAGIAVKKPVKEPVAVQTSVQGTETGGTAVPAPSGGSKAHGKKTGQAHCILVLGMHRSGTSAATRVLNLLGADLSANLVGAHESNVTGHWEPADIVAIHEELLSSAGSSWEDWRSFNPDWVRSPTAARFRTRIEDILRQDFQNSNLFALKDPRICRFLPFWQSVLADLDIQPHALIMVRHPLDVAASLRARNNMPQSKALLIWLRHSLDVELETRALPRCFVRYEELLEDWRRAFRRASEEFGVVWPRWSPGSEALADRFLDPGLQHHRTGDRSVSRSTGLHPWFEDTYQALLRLCSGQGGEAERRRLDAIRSAFDEATGALSGPMAALETELGEQHGTVAHLRQENARLAGLAAQATDGAPRAELQAELDTVRQQADAHTAAAREAIGALEAALAVSRNEHDTDRVAHEEALGALRGELEAIQRECEDLRAQREAQREAERVADQVGHEETLGALRGELEAIQREYEDLRAQREVERVADQVGHEETLGALRGELEAIQRERDGLSAEQGMLRATLAERDTLLGQSRQLAARQEARIEGERTVHAKLHERMERERKALQEAHAQELGGVKAALAAAVARVQELEQEQQAGARDEHDGLRAEMEATRRECEELRAEREADRVAHEETLGTLRGELEAIQRERDGLSAEQGMLRATLAERDTLLGQSRQLAARQEARIEGERVVHAKLHERMERERKTIQEAHAQELGGVKAALAAADARVQELEQAQQAGAHEIDGLRQRVDDSKTAVMSLTGQLADAQAELRRSAQTMEGLVRQLDEVHLDQLRQENALLKADTAIAHGLQREAVIRQSLTEVQRERGALQNALVAEQDQVGQLVRALVERDDGIATLAAARDQVEQALAEARAEIDGLHAATRERAGEAAALSVERAASLREAGQLRLLDAERLAAIRSLKAEADIVRQERARAEENLIEARKTLNAAVAEQRHLEAERRKWRDTMELLAELSASPEMMSEWINSAAQTLSSSPLFDPSYYSTQAGRSFRTVQDAVVHYLSVGWKEGLDPNPLFDTSWYLEQNPDVAASGLIPLLHFVSRGRTLARFPHPLFDTGWYLERYPDVAETGINPLSHYLMFGAHEGRSPNPLFSPEWYKASSPEAANAPVDPLVHYALVGGTQGCDPCPLFDAAWYKAVNPDVDASGLTPLGHYLHVGSRRGATPNPLFDAVWYKDFHRDVAASGLDPFVHYLHWGRVEQRAPNAFFDPAWYLETYTDVRDAGVDPFVHYMNDGWKERRDPSPMFSTGWYLDTYPDIRAAKLNPLLHFLCDGRAEGRLAHSADPAGQSRLSADRGLAEAEFSKWRMNTLFRARTAASKGKPGRALPRLLVVFTAGTADEARRLPASLAAIADSALHSRMDWIAFDPTGTAMAAGVPDGGAICTDIGELAVRLDACGEGGLVCFLRAGDRLDTAAVDALEQTAANGPQFILFDLYHRRDGSVYPLLLPGVNLTHALNCDYFRSRFAARPRLAAAAVRGTGQAGGHAAGLRIMAELTARRDHGALAHIALPLVEVPDQKAAIAGERLAAIDPATPTIFVPAGIAPAPAPAPAGVSVIISTKDKGHLTDLLVRQILALGDAVEDVVIVSNRTTNPVARATLARLSEHPKVTLVKHDAAYNFSTQSNLGAQKAKGELLLFLNDDIVPIGNAWLEDLLAPLANPEVAACGPLLLYPDERVQHGGMFLGYNGLAGHTLRHATLPEEDYMFLASAPREVSAVTGAALVIRRGVFEDLNGFDAQMATYLQDVDLCLRVLETGHRIVFTPRSILLHMESVSLNEVVDSPEIQELRTLESRYFADRWGARIGSDRYHNPCFASEDETLRTLR